MSEHSRSSKSRAYQMRARAEQMDETRHRIVAAAVELHGSVGPAATTIAAIADLAHVTRLTVYRHFPDETALFNACSAHWLSQQRLPDPDTWEQISGPADRLRVGLADLYRFFHAGADMLAHIYRDFAALPQEHQQRLLERDQRHLEILLTPFPHACRESRRMRAVVGHAISFWTWYSLCIEQGLSDEDAVEIMAGMVAAVLPDERDMTAHAASVSSR